MRGNPVFRDNTFWSLLAVNASIAVYYFMHGGNPASIYVVYWIQSVIIGLFQFLRIIR